MTTQDRREYIGGSDAAAIMGVSKWATPLQCYLEKIGEAPPREPDDQREKIFRRGKRLEPIVIDMLIDEYGLQVTKRSPPENPNRYHHPDYDFLRAEIDFEFLVDRNIVEQCDGMIDPALIGTIQNGEIKTSHPNASGNWGEMFTEEIPIEYAAQSMHGLMVTNRHFCLYGTLVGADDLSLYGVRRDDETITGMLSRELQFWRCVQDRIPPDPSTMADVLGLMYRIKGRPIEATGAIAEAVANLKQIKSSIKAFEADEDRVKFEIAAFIFQNLKELQERDPRVSLEDATALEFAGRTLLTWKMQEANRIDTKRLRAEVPDIAEQFTNTTHSRVMRIK